MFVTVLGRLENIDLQFWSSDAAPNFFDDVPSASYYAPYVRWATCNGIVSGISKTEFAPDDPITREQMAKLVAYYTERMGYSLLPASEGVHIPDAFADADQIAHWAAGSVEALRKTAILNGSTGSDGKTRFLPQNTATRAECAAVFSRLKAALMKPENSAAQPTSVTLSETQLELNVGEQHSLTATVLPEGKHSLLWRSSDDSVATVDANGVVTCRGKGTATITVYTGNGLSADCSLVCTEDLASADESYEAKCIRLFGKVVNEPRLYYTDQATAKADMTQITVPVWDFDTKGGKVTKYMQLSVHKKLAPTVIAIFNEIYAGTEKFPIHYLGGWNWSGKSEHSIGSAIDINPNENYYCDPQGNAIVGNYWKPGEDPYSIPLDGEVAQIFAKYGFSQGVNWRNGYKDYMHFSYFGT